MLNTLRNVDPLSYVVLVVIALYIALVNPSNTPAIFSNPIFKFVLFVFVGLVCILEGSAIGVLFAVAMALPVVYSSLREGYANPFVEGFEENDGSEVVSDDEDDSSQPRKKHARNHKHPGNHKHHDHHTGHQGIPHTPKHHQHHKGIHHTSKPNHH